MELVLLQGRLNLSLYKYIYIFCTLMYINVKLLYVMLCIEENKLNCFVALGFQMNWEQEIHMEAKALLVLLWFL